MLEQLDDGLGLGLDGAGGGFLHEDVPVLAMLEGEEDKVHGFFERHDEAGHLGLGEGDGVAFADLVDPEWDDAAAGAHDVAVAGAADLGVTGKAALRHGEKMYETLLTKEEAAKAIDMGNFYAVPADNRDLNYDKFFKDGDTKRATIDEFNSDNTRRLNLEETKAKIASLEYIQNELNGIPNIVK